MSLTATFTGTGGFAPPPSGSIAAPKLRIILFTNAKPAASQSGGLTHLQGAYQAAITIASTGSSAVCSTQAGPPSKSLTADPLSTLLDNIQDTTNGIRHGSFIATALTASTGSKTYGSNASFGADGTCCVAEIQAQGGTLTRDTGNEPSVATSTTGSAATTAPFTPQPGSLIVALVDGVCTGGGMSDNTGGLLTWALATSDGTDGYSGIFLATMPNVDSGTGSVAMQKMGLSGSGVGKTAGTGSIGMHKMGLSGTSVVRISATGSVDMHKMGLSATGLAGVSATGSVDMHKMGLSGTGEVGAIVGLGSVNMHKMSLSAVGTTSTAGSGSVDMHKMGLSGTIVEKIFGTGSVDMHKMSLIGTAAGGISATGSVDMHKMGLSASGTATQNSVVGSGSVAMHKMRIGQQQTDSSLFIFSPL